MGIVQADMHHQLERINVDEGRVVREIQCRLSETSLADTKKELRQLSDQLSALNEYAAKLYEDRLTGIINLDTFSQLSARTEEERITATRKHQRLLSAVESAERQVLDIDRWVDGIRRAVSLETLDHETLCALIERIEVGERETGSKGKLPRQAVRIVYRFVRQLG